MAYTQQYECYDDILAARRLFPGVSTSGLAGRLCCLRERYQPL